VEIDLSQFQETFFQEAAEHLETMEAALLRLQAGGGDAETLHCIFRCAHSIKAGAATFGFDAPTRFTHVLETLLDRMRTGETAASAPLLELLLCAVDVLRSLVAGAAGTGPLPDGWLQLMAELERVPGGGKSVPGGMNGPSAAAAVPAVPASSPSGYSIRFAPAPEMLRLGLDPLLVLRDLAELGTLTAEADLSRLPRLDALELDTCYLGWRLKLETTAEAGQIRDAFAFVEDVATVAIEPLEAAAAAPAAEASAAAANAAAKRPVVRETLRVATVKVDRLIDLVGELVIAQSMAAQLVRDFTPGSLPHLQAAMADIDRYTRELQERAMHIRMMPVGSIFSRFPRLVHDTGKSLGKSVVLTIEGEETELDKGVVERIADPLTHLVRNAVDHGIEMPADRLLAGKPADGSLRLTAYHQGGNVIVEVADDGRGLDTARIRAKGIERGLIAADDELSDEQIHALIFRPGFSTAATVTGLSGRGVGMDVVKKSVDALNGAVSIETAIGRGSTIRIKLPLTLAVLDGLLLRVAAQTFVLPLAVIVESIQPRRDQVQTLAGRGEVVVVRKEALTLVRLSGIFGIDTPVTHPADGLVVVVEQDGRRWAVLVDEVLGQQQVIVKSLETNFRKVEGITGATILGDGRAALILDIAGVVAMARAA
jgi:two-component system, chemotaxis family, sensor kinase CheA